MDLDSIDRPLRQTAATEIRNRPLQHRGILAVPEKANIFSCPSSRSEILNAKTRPERLMSHELPFSAPSARNHELRQRARHTCTTREEPEHPWHRSRPRSFSFEQEPSGSAEHYCTYSGDGGRRQSD